MYSDVPKDHWAYTNITWATKLGIMKGYPDGTFLPNNPVTRAEAATISMRVLGIGFLASSAALAAYAIYNETRRKK